MLRSVCLFFSLVGMVGCNAGSSQPRTVTPDTIAARGDCAALTGAGTSHSTNITADETWTAAGSPHLVSSLRVEATLTLEPCAVVQLAKEAELTIGNGGTGKPGKIIAQGTFDGTSLKPIVFRPQTDGQRFSTLYVQETGSVDLAYVAILGGGNAVAPSSNAALFATGTGQRPMQQKLRLRNVVIRDSGTQGVSLRSYAAFATDSENLFISTSGAETERDARFLTGFPLDIQPPGLATIPKGSVLTGNRRDAVYVRSVTRLDVDEAFPNRGLPYLINGTFLMYDLQGSTLSLQLEAGVTLRFENTDGQGGLGLILGNKASAAPVRLIAPGTAAAPITLTSAQPNPVAGDWAGVLMANAPDSGNVVEYATFEYAGGPTGTSGYGCGPGRNVGGLVLIDWRPASAFVKNSTFRNNLGAGIVCGWTSDEPGPDLRTSNTFSGMVDLPQQGSCNVTRWAPKTGSCAMRPVCL